MIPVRIRPAARRDIASIAEYLIQESDDVLLGDRFLSNVAETLDLLRSFPKLGRLRKTRNEDIASVRSILLKPPFMRYVIFYEDHTAELEVVRVLHSAQNAKFWLDIEPEKID